jgi:hypothetical protein
MRPLLSYAIITMVRLPTAEPAASSLRLGYAFRTAIRHADEIPRLP